MSRLKRVLHFQSAGLVAAVAFGIWLWRTFPVLDVILNARQALGELGLRGALLYPLLFALCNVLLLPGGVIAVGSGLFFGLWWGFLLNLCGSLLGAAVAFLLSRQLGRRRLEKRFLGRRKWAALDQAIAREGWKIIFLSQLHPLFPTSLLNYLYGVTRVRFRVCMLWIALGQAPGLFLYAYLGTLTGFSLQVWTGRSRPLFSEYGLWLGGLVLTVAISMLLARIARRTLAEVTLQQAPGAALEQAPL